MSLEELAGWKKDPASGIGKRSPEAGKKWGELFLVFVKTCRKFMKKTAGQVIRSMV